ncbi:DUF2129 domain-containing protein [Atopobacter phocae]|uniref:DUF2129 domain-containing protein n=1 Tax=Atopobacter phocae TaxID=136492 RepID=UPI0004702BB5|nr:DUF2129 domain-containing protein [Atopobacter phocae]
MTFKKNLRKKLVIHLYTLKKINQLKRFGFVHYVSQRMKYVVLYVDDHYAQQTRQKLNKLHFVRSIEEEIPEIITKDYSNVLEEVVQAETLSLKDNPYNIEENSSCK